MIFATGLNNTTPRSSKSATAMFQQKNVHLNRHYEQKFCMQPECSFLPTPRHILAFVARATRLRVFLG